MKAQRLSVQNLAKSYGKRQVIKDVSIQISSGEIIGLLGPNGAGKTTCFLILLGFVRCDNGSVILNDENITRMSIDQRAKKGLGYLPQDSSIFRKLSVTDNIMAILELNKNLTKQQRLYKCDQLIEEFGLEHIRSSIGMSLSGGERRRVEIARSLATDPIFILLDEPFAGIDPISVLEINKLIILLKEKGMGILITDHNIRETLAICERVYIVGEGRVMAQGSKKEILNDSRVKQVYLGESFNM